MGIRKLTGPVVLAFVAAALLAPSAASAWAPAASAPIHPGVQTVTEGAQCTSNFVFQDATSVYIGQAAHCSGPAPRPIPTAATVRRFPSVPGSTWTAPAGREPWSTTRGSRCRGCVRATRTPAPTTTWHWSDSTRPTCANVNPSVPGFGGPTGVGSAGAQGATVYTYGNSSLRLGVTKLSPKQGIAGPGSGQWLEPRRLHRDAGHPR